MGNNGWTVTASLAQMAQPAGWLSHWAIWAIEPLSLTGIPVWLKWLNQQGGWAIEPFEPLSHLSHWAIEAVDGTFQCTVDKIRIPTLLWGARLEIRFWSAYCWLSQTGIPVNFLTFLPNFLTFLPWLVFQSTFLLSYQAVTRSCSSCSSCYSKLFKLFKLLLQAVTRSCYS